MKKNKKHHNFSNSSFGARVYAVVAKIPRGKNMTYKQVAAAAGSPRAYRGVGHWMSKNYNPKIPCHRVIRSDGKVGNYNRGGPKKKLALLKKEGAL
jgi:O-6-methylguanine DNA methyltransferase